VLPGVRFDVELFARELAALLDAGVGVIDALRTLGGNDRREASARVYGNLLRQLEEGHSLSAAMVNASNVFPDVLIACVKASEQTGGLADSLRRYSRNSATLQALRARVVSAAIYPSVLLVVGMAVVLFLLAFVVPRFAALLEHSGRELPLMSRWLMMWAARCTGTAPPSHWHSACCFWPASLRYSVSPYAICWPIGCLRCLASGRISASIANRNFSEPRRCWWKEGSPPYTPSSCRKGS
jgi:general secretion pathway protein F